MMFDKVLIYDRWTLAFFFFPPAYSFLFASFICGDTWAARVFVGEYYA